MTDEQRNYLEERFRFYEAKSTQLVVILFSIIMLIHTINPEGMWKVDAVRYLWYLCLTLIIGFILGEFLKDMFYPLIGKILFKDKNN
jgi:hypothetical protein